MLGLPNPTSGDVVDYVRHPMYGMSTIRENLPGGAHFGRILVFGIC